MSHASAIFGHYGAGDLPPRHWLAASPGSLGLGAAILIAAARTAVVGPTPDAPRDVIFVDTVVKPAAAPRDEAPPLRPAVRKLTVPPRDLPRAVPPETDVGAAPPPTVWLPSEEEIAGGLRSGADGQSSEIREDDLPGTVRAQPFKDNPAPAYPKIARKAGKEAVVSLKIRITTDGQVAEVQVVEGEEPFTTSAVATVKKWRYTPASYQGKAISIYRVIKIAFQLS